MELYFDKANPISNIVRICAAINGVELKVRSGKDAEQGLAGLNGKQRSLLVSQGKSIANHGIVKYIAQSGAAKLYPRPPYSNGASYKLSQIDAWIDFSRQTIASSTAMLAESKVPKIREDQLANLEQGLATLNKHLQTQTFLVGDSLTLADIALAAELVTAMQQHIDQTARTKVPATMRWFNTITNMPNVSKVLGTVKFLDKSAAKAAAKSTPKTASRSMPAKQGNQAPKGGAGAKEVKKESKMGLGVAKEEDFGNWYSELVVKSGLISYYAVSGCYVLWEDSFAMWETVSGYFNEEIKKLGVKNAYFPLFVTEEVLCREQDHVEGFAPEVAWVTRSGQKDLDKPIAIRPTSETVMYPYYAQRIRSHRDLPLKLNQWTNVVRWEFKDPTPFIRSREFLWQEGHTCFATKEEADVEVRQILELYRQVYEELLAVPVVMGTKSKAEQFAGALYTTSIEAYIPETGRGVQGATSHCLGQNFSKMFGITFTGGEKEDEEANFVWQNSWGLTTRSLGVMIMTHSDNKGLVIPPKVAPVQVVVIPIPKKDAGEKEALYKKADEIADALVAQGMRVEVDKRENYTPGWKYNHWELKGVCLRVELGPKDLQNQTARVVRRDTGAKDDLALSGLESSIKSTLDVMQTDLFKSASARVSAHKRTAFDKDTLLAALNDKCCCLAPWCDEEEVEEEIKKWSAAGGSLGAKTLNIPFEQPADPPISTLKCFYTGKPAKNWALFGRSY